MSSSADNDNKNKDILLLGEGATRGLDSATLTAGAEYSIKFSKSEGKFCVSPRFFC